MMQKDEEAPGSLPRVADADNDAIDAGPAYSALTHGQRGFLLAVASLAATISPASTTTYYPAITPLATDLHVSVTLINLTITTYQVRYHIIPGLARAAHER